jgi:hypothetical protein
MIIVSVADDSQLSCRLDKITNQLTKRIVLFIVSNSVGSDDSSGSTTETFCFMISHFTRKM